MKIAIHKREDSFSYECIQYCDKHEIPYKLVDCYQSDIIEDLDDCDALMWHFSQAIAKDLVFAKQLLFSLESAGKIVFPQKHWQFPQHLKINFDISDNAPEILQI